MSAPLARKFGDVRSGNRRKLKVAADLLGRPYAWTEIDVSKGETRTPQVLARNPFGQQPAVEFGDGRHLTQSNAIVRPLVGGSALPPNARLGHEGGFDLASRPALRAWIARRENELKRPQALPASGEKRH